MTNALTLPKVTTSAWLRGLGWALVQALQTQLSVAVQRPLVLQPLRAAAETWGSPGQLPPGGHT